MLEIFFSGFNSDFLFLPISYRDSVVSRPKTTQHFDHYFVIFLVMEVYIVLFLVKIFAVGWANVQPVLFNP
jgi:hypothetical protein